MKLPLVQIHPQPLMRQQMSSQPRLPKDLPHELAWTSPSTASLERQQMFQQPRLHLLLPHGRSFLPASLMRQQTFQQLLMKLHLRQHHSLPLMRQQMSLFLSGQGAGRSGPSTSASMMRQQMSQGRGAYWRPPLSLRQSRETAALLKLPPDLPLM